MSAFDPTEFRRLSEAIGPRPSFLLMSSHETQAAYAATVCAFEDYCVTHRDRIVALLEAADAQEAALTDTARHYADGMKFYQDIVVQVGELLGAAAYVSDDGSVQGGVLALKVPELVKARLEAADMLAVVAEHAHTAMTSDVYENTKWLAARKLHESLAAYKKAKGA